MSGVVESVVEQLSPQSGKSTPGSSEYSRIFRVTLDDSFCGPYYAIRAFGDGIPNIGDTYPADPFAYVMAWNCSQVGDEPVFDVRVDYSTIENAISNDPEDWAAVLSWGFVTKTVVVETDVVTGNAIASSAGEVFIPPLEDDNYNLKGIVVRNESDLFWDPGLASLAEGRVNSNYGMVLGIIIAPGQALMRSISSRRETYAGIYYYKVTYEIEFDQGGFVREVLDQGTYYLDGSGNKQMFRDGGELADRPHNLNGFGGQLVSPASPVYIPFDTKYSFDFSLLGLENP